MTVIAPVVIAVDGPAAAGKGTLARRLAAHYALPYLDTGLLYRAVGRRVLDAGADPRDAAAAETAARALRAGDLSRNDLRGPPADGAASTVAAHPGVRAALVDFQRRFAAADGAVLDGRDIGTVIFPDATAKLYVTASAEARARRRWREVGGEFAAVAAEMAARDARDAGRSAAPMRPADDALLLDSTELDADAAFARALAMLAPRLDLPAAALEGLARRWMALWQGADLAGINALHAPCFIDHSPDGRPGDRAGFAGGIAALRTAFPDFHAETAAMVVDAARQSVAIRWHATGSHRGAFLGCAPTGLPVTFTGIEIIECRAGRVAARWGEWDGLALRAQLESEA
jgi:cytidylate kinase